MTSVPGGGWAGRRVLLLGASGGIGAAVATELAHRAAHLALSGRRVAALDRVAAACERAGGRAWVVPADLAREDDAARLAARALSLLGGCDVFISAAGVPCRVHAARLSAGQVRETMQVNFLGPATVALGVLPDMLRAGRGELVAVGSLAGRVPTPREAAYAASKHALAAWMDALAIDLRSTGVGVHVVSPAVVDTPLWSTPGQERAAVSGRGVVPEAVAAAVVRLIEGGRHEAFVPARHRVTAAIAAIARAGFIRAASLYDRRRVPWGQP